LSFALEFLSIVSSNGAQTRWARLSSRASQRQALRRELAGELTGFWLDEWSRAGSTESVISRAYEVCQLISLQRYLYLS
jgi:hypothetical protein